MLPLLESVGRSLWQRLSVNAIVDAFGRGELWGQGLGNSVQKLDICRKRILTLFSPLSAKNWGSRCGAGTFNGILRRFSRDVDGRKALEIDHRFSGFLACSIGSGLVSRRWLT